MTFQLPPKASGPKSLCTCGHTGDTDPHFGALSDHAGSLGHGICKVAGCACKKFTWREFIDRRILNAPSGGKQ